MKTLLIGLTLLASTLTVSANDFTIEERAKLHTVKMMLEIQRERVAETVESVREYAKAYSELGAFSFSKKKRLRAYNCNEIKSSLSTSLLMVATSIENAGDAFDKVEVSDEDGSTIQENFLAYSQLAIKASKNCRKVEKSAEIMEEAFEKLVIASGLLEEALPQIIEEEE